MKGAIKIIVAVAFLTVPVMLYVHGKLALFQVSYDLSDGTELLSRKVEEYRLLKFEVDQLKAPGLLERRMKESELGLVLPREVHMMEVPASPSFGNAAVAREAVNPFADRLSHFLGRWIGVAQAKTESS